MLPMLRARTSEATWVHLRRSTAMSNDWGPPCRLGHFLGRRNPKVTPVSCNIRRYAIIGGILSLTVWQGSSWTLQLDPNASRIWYEDEGTETWQAKNWDWRITAESIQKGSDWIFSRHSHHNFYNKLRLRIGILYEYICVWKPKLSYVALWCLMLRTDPVVCSDCNIEDSLSSNMRRELQKILRIRSVFCFRIRSFQGFRVLGF